MLICAVPMNYHLGYGAFTTAYINRQEKLVVGAALSYADGRNRLAMYSSDDTDRARRRVESEIAGGFLLAQHARVPLDSRFVLGLVEFGADFDRLVARIDTAVRGFESIDFQRVVMAMQPMVRPVNLQATELILPALEELVRGTIEAIMITRLRVMRWQGLSLQGYRFFEGQQEVGITPVRDMQEQQRRVRDIENRAEVSNIFNMKLSWLKEYIEHELAVMNVELEGASLGPSKG
jgi:hypothetical protein